MARALNKLSDFRYVLEADRELPLAEQTVFVLRPMTGAQFLESRESVWKQNSTQAFLTALRYGLVGWENFHDEAGEVKFLPVVSDNIARLSTSQIIELGSEIRKASELIEAEKKT